MARDYLIQLIEEASLNLALAIRARAGGQHSDTEHYLQQAFGALVDLPPGVFKYMNSLSLARYLNAPAKIRLVARISHFAGELALDEENPLEAMTMLQRALELHLEASEAGDPDDMQDPLFALLSHVQEDLLSDRYRALLALHLPKFGVGTQTPS